jgi:hypothetical protein
MNQLALAFVLAISLCVTTSGCSDDDFSSDGAAPGNDLAVSVYFGPVDLANGPVDLTTGATDGGTD